VTTERKCTLYVCAQARNQVMQRNHEQAHDNSGCTANRLCNTAHPPNQITSLVGLKDVCLEHSQPHTRCRAMERTGEQAPRAGCCQCSLISSYALARTLRSRAIYSPMITVGMPPRESTASKRRAVDNRRVVRRKSILTESMGSHKGKSTNSENAVSPPNPALTGECSKDS
jgi:hypothetical protein